jgi:hypothetical protein
MKDLQKKANEMLPDNYELVYLTHFGSKLYGTESIESDTDLKGIFIPSINDVLLQKASDNFSYSSGNKNSRNNSNDLDIELWSISKFFKLLTKGETGAIDLLFSMFRRDTIIYHDTSFIKQIKDNYYIFLSKNFKAFIGYCMGQAQKYGIKGSRFSELGLIKSWWDDYIKITTDAKVNFSVSNFFDSVEEKVDNLKFSKMIKTDKGRYFSILGKMHHDRISLEMFHKQLMSQYNSYGERTKKALEGVDYKALSHAVRVLYEMEELIDTKFIKFPLKNRDFIRAIKYNDLHQYSLEDLFDMISLTIDEVQILIDKSTLPSKVNQKEIDDLHLSILRYYYQL